MRWPPEIVAALRAEARAVVDRRTSRPTQLNILHMRKQGFTPILPQHVQYGPDCIKFPKFGALRFTPEEVAAVRALPVRMFYIRARRYKPPMVEVSFEEPRKPAEEDEDAERAIEC